VAAVDFMAVDQLAADGELIADGLDELERIRARRMIGLAGN
jgi:hypothetical protein